MSGLSPTTAAALDALALDGRPLMIVDVDEVVLQFVPHLERFIAARGFALVARSFALTGNVVRAGSTSAIPGDEVKGLIDAFFREEVERQVPVDGALCGLARLADLGCVVLLTNVPDFAAEARGRHLADLGVGAQVVANHGAKGPALARLAARRREITGATDALPGAGLYFLDDGPNHIASARDHVGGARLVHFIDDPRYFRMAPDVGGTWLKTRDWGEVVARIEDDLAATG
jgi:hypothetical protein